MSEQERFQLSASAAEIYELQKVPSIFGPLAEKTLDLIDYAGRRRMLDLACGSGALARALLARSSDKVASLGVPARMGSAFAML